MKKTLKIICIILLSLLIIAAVGITAYSGHQVVINSTQLTQPQDPFVIPYNVFSSNHLDYNAFTEKYSIEKLSLPSSKDGHQIPADLIYADQPGEKDHDTVIMVHGLGGNRMSVYPPAQVFLENGYNVLAYDQRSSGENQAPLTTFGYLEKFDLLDWAAEIRNWAPEKKLGVWGTSFGGITATLAVCDPALGLTEHADFLILDSPVSNVEDEIRMVIDSEDMGIPTDYLIWAGNIMNRIELGFGYKDADGREIIRNRLNKGSRHLPLLIFICGRDDTTPYPQGADLYELYGGENKTLINFEDSGHANSWKDHEAEYREAVQNLLDQIHE